MGTLILLVAVVLTISFFASLTEAALLAVPYAKARAMAEAKRPGAASLLKIKDRMSDAISAVVVVDNVADIIGSALVGLAAGEVLRSTALGVFFAAFTFVAILGGKIVPKTIGESHAAAIAPLAAPAVLVIVSVFRPFLWIVDRTLKALRLGSSPAAISEEEIKIMAAMGRETGSIESDESHLIQRVFKLNDITAEDMMTPLASVEAISGDATLGQLREIILKTRHSRLPVYSESVDNILGVVMLRDLLMAMSRDRFETTPMDYLQEAISVPADLAADDLLPLFQKQEQHLGIVIDADKKMVGVVSLEDVLEELVGEITDEKDIRPETIKRVSKSEILVDEGTDVAKINHFFNTAIAAEGAIGDHVMGLFKHRPKAGESAQDGPLTFTVAAMSRTRPKLINIRKA
jgi:CBS domain containing-hemolysin-like protein